MDVKTIRQQLNLTQWELAKMTGIPRDRIAKWEQGKGVPKAEDQKVIEKLFGKKVPDAPVDALEAHTDKKKQKTNSDKEKVQTMTTRPTYEMQPTNGNSNVKDATIKVQADVMKSQQELITELAKNVMQLTGKLIEKK